MSFSPRAVDVINHRRTKVQSWYLDMTMVQRYWGEDRFYHHTAPITMIYAIREGLRLLQGRSYPSDLGARPAPGRGNVPGTFPTRVNHA